MISVIIPAHNEELWLNRTINNIYETCSIHPEVIVVDQGGNGKIDKRARVIRPGENVGERKAMNLAARAAKNEFLFRIDAHCDFSPQGWDVLMTDATGEKDLTIAVLTALDKQWNRLKGHWYGFCRLLPTARCTTCGQYVPLEGDGIAAHERKRKQPCEGRTYDGPVGLECKWQKPNRDHSAYQPIEPNMGATGCAMMIRKAFYEEIGGADENLPKMGAIGEEFAVKAWAHGGKCQTRTDVMVGHIFDTGGYDTTGVRIAQQRLWQQYGHCYDAVAEKFPNFEGIKLIRTDNPHPTDNRQVIVTRRDTRETLDPDTGKPLRIKTEIFKYVWLADEHPEEKDWTEEQIDLKYAKLGTKIGEEVQYVTAAGDKVLALAP